MSVTRAAAVNSRVNIPISPETRSEMEEVATIKGVSLAELGRLALEAYLIRERRRFRLERLKASAIKYADVIEGVAEEWRETEVEGWPND